jgi:hypothetical protein
MFAIVHAILPHSISLQDARWLEVGMERDSIERHFGSPAEQTAFQDIYNLDSGGSVRIVYQADHATSITVVSPAGTRDAVEVNLHGRTVFGGNNP